MSNTSIIIPVYCKNKQELEWFEECLDSAVGQASVIVWDDGSPIDIMPVVQLYVDCDVRVYRGDDRRGPSYARNMAVGAATTPCIFPLDADDILVEGAIERLEELWNGVPVYPDVCKFGDEDVPHYELLDDWCIHITTKVGVASVCVFHSKEQWQGIGGWNESIEYYEDGEYNARLFLRYCAVHHREPLVRYRIHSGQRTKLAGRNVKNDVRNILYRIQEYERRLGDMSCPGCGGKRRTVSSSKGGRVRRTFGARGPRPIPAHPSHSIPGLPGSSGALVLARYMGQNPHTHYYRGVTTRHSYKVRAGDIISADPRDCREENKGDARVLLVLVTPPSPPPAPKAVEKAVAKAVKSVKKRSPRTAPKKRRAKK